MTQEARDQRGGAPRRRVSHDPVLAGLVVSALAHVLLIALYPFFSAGYPESSSAPDQPAVSEAEGMRVLQVVEVSGSVIADPDDPEEIEDPGEPNVVPEVPDIEEDLRVRFPGRYRSAAERLRLGKGDPRLWAPLDLELAGPSRDQILQLRLLAAIESANDSAATDAERMREAMDWTHTDEDGNRWGISPGQIHLGDITIPLPYGFGPPPDYNGDQADWAFRMADIERAAGSVAARRSWKERMEVMRLRRERLRAEEDEDRAKNPPVVKPDTTSGGRKRR